VFGKDMLKENQPTKHFFCRHIGVKPLIID